MDVWSLFSLPMMTLLGVFSIPSSILGGLLPSYLLGWRSAQTPNSKLKLEKLKYLNVTGQIKRVESNKRITVLILIHLALLAMHPPLFSWLF